MLRLPVQFTIHNSHLEGVDQFADRDPQLRRLNSQPLRCVPALVTELPTTQPGVYALGGARQVGKTTLLKQWMQALLHHVPANRVLFFTGELIDDHHTLVRMLSDVLDSAAGSPSSSQLYYIVVDEITYVREWDRAIKYLADAGLLEHVVLILTGSDLTLMKHARMRFPGRRGQAAKVDFHLYPLSFAEYLDLVDLTLCDEELRSPSPETLEVLYQRFDDYLVHGGFLSAINDFARAGTIQDATLSTYSDWIRGDILKQGKHEETLRELLAALTKSYGSQVTWTGLARKLSVHHHQTVADYVELLQNMDALYVQQALQEHTLTGAPKKARKIICTDPFIFHSINHWLHPQRNGFSAQITPLLADNETKSKLIEACVSGLYRRYVPTYYIKGKSEIDIAYVHNNAFFPIEIKWRTQHDDKALKQLAGYANASLLTRSRTSSTVQGIRSKPLPLALATEWPFRNE